MVRIFLGETSRYYSSIFPQFSLEESTIVTTSSVEFSHLFEKKKEKKFYLREYNAISVKLKYWVKCI